MSASNIIPTPPSVRWKEFRIRILPGIVFLLSLTAAAYIWKTFIFPGSLVGKIQGRQASVASYKAGWISKLYIQRFQDVTTGDPIAEISTADPRFVESSLDLVRTEIELIRAGMNPAANTQRNAINYDTLRLDWLRHRIDLATAKAEQQRTENEYQRMIKLHEDKLISDSQFEQAKAEMEIQKSAVTERTLISESMEKRIAELGYLESANNNPSNQIRLAIQAQEQRLKQLEAELSPIIIKAAISGKISMVYKWEGETVTPGDTIATISAQQSDRIIAYLRQPFHWQPETNMWVEVRTRGFTREGGLGRILAIGDQLQPINESLLPPTKYNVSEEGLPISISLPEPLKNRPGERPKVHPGEYVDLTILPNHRSK